MKFSVFNPSRLIGLRHLRRAKSLPLARDSRARRIFFQNATVMRAGGTVLVGPGPT